HLPALPGLCRRPVARLFGSFVRRRQGAARRLVRDAAGAAQHALSRLRLARLRRGLLRLSQLRGLTRARPLLDAMVDWARGGISIAAGTALDSKRRSLGD